MGIAATAAPNAAAIWKELLGNGATPIQAAGIMANMWFESNFNPESDAIDSNGLRSVGLINWNNNPTAQGLLTGNATNDIKSQVRYLVSSGGLSAASGSTPGQAAASFAHTYERCAACGYQGGSSQLTSRASIAQPIYTAGTSGGWGPTTSSGLPPAGTGTLASDSSTNPCLIKLPSVVGIGGGCLFKESNGRAAIGGLLLAAGGLIALAGLVLLVGAEAVSGIAPGAPTVKPVAAAARFASKSRLGVGP